MSGLVNHTGLSCAAENYELSVISSNQLDNKNKDNCAICLEQYREPIYLQCMHAFCGKPCLQTLLDASKNNVFKCPLCRYNFNAKTLECLGPESAKKADVTQPLPVASTEQRDIDLEMNVCSTLFSLWLFVNIVHFGFVSIVRVILGCYCYEHSKELSDFQISKGCIDFSIVLLRCVEKRKREFTALHVIISTICIVIGTVVAWRAKDTRCDFLIRFSRYYIVVDCVMSISVLLIIFKSNRNTTRTS